MQTIMMMDFDFRLVQEFGQYVSMSYKRSFFGVGSFQLTLEKGMPGAEKLRPDRLLFLPERKEEMFLTEKVSRNGNRVTASGVQLKGLCKRRICVPPLVNNDESGYGFFGWDRFNGDAESAYLHFAGNNLVRPEDGKRKMPGVILGENQHRGKALPWQARFDRLSDVLEDIGAATGLGWDIRPDFAGKQFVFSAWEGQDRTKGGGLVTLSRELGNLDDFSLTEDRSVMKNTIYAGGSGNDEERLILSVGTEQEGFLRREGWAEVSGAEDTELLRMGAERHLEDEKRTLTVSVADSGLCRYGRDYDVGDLIRVRAEEYVMDARLIEMEVVMEAGVRSLNATFGDAPVTLTAMFRKWRKGAAK